MNKILEFVRRHWLVVLMGIVILFLLKNSLLGMSAVRYPSSVGLTDVANSPMANTFSKSLSIGGMGGSSYSQPAPTEQTNRMVVQDTNMSMLVKDVTVATKGIEKQAVTAGGYMVSRSISKPEGAASGYISLRVPTEKRDDVMEAIRGLGVKVVSENVNGHDVTDQYVDIEGRITSLEKTKARIQAIMDQATQVSDLMSIQMQLTSIEQQIDGYKGQQNYLAQTAKLTLISVNLSTDELALPYAPDQAWRPEVVFKQAVRSMLGTLRSVGNLAIWIVVYAPVWLVILGAVYLFKKIKSRKSTV